MSEQSRKEELSEQGERSQVSAEQSEARSGERREQSKLTWLVPLGLLAFFGLLYLIWPGFRDFIDTAVSISLSGDRQRLEDWVDGFGAWGPVVILLLMIMQTVIAFIPSVIIMVVTVLAFGPFWGGVLTWAGLLVSATVAFAIGRALGPVTVDKLIGQSTEQKVEGFVHEYGVWAIIAARVSPALSTDAVSLVAGLAEMGYLRFIAATAAGTLPLTVLIAWLGADINRLEVGLLWVSVVSLAIFVAYVIWDRRRSDESLGEQAANQ